jgi:hypothetical protein
MPVEPNISDNLGLWRMNQDFSIEANKAIPAWYAAPTEVFIAETPNSIIGQLSKNSGFDIDTSQRDAWLEEIRLLQAILDGVQGWVYLEFEVPRLGSRIDAVIVTTRSVIPIEFKVGARSYFSADRDQTWDYALDLKNFHEPSRDVWIFPILVATLASDEASDQYWSKAHTDRVYPPFRANTGGLRPALAAALELGGEQVIDANDWGRGRYCPSPTIIEAARTLYATHSVDSITRNDAGATNLSHTCAAIEDILDHSRRFQRKSIVFVTGVPGAGKTLVGLNVATRHSERKDAVHSVYLSGNQPLVSVLQEALIRDEFTRRKSRGESIRKGEVAQRVKPFIQIVHHWRDEALRMARAATPEHVVIFDEAQRAWDQAKTSDFMQKKKGQKGFAMSEPEFLISVMDRQMEWAVIICLVGGGQEINSGEAGISEWFAALARSFPNWDVYHSSRIFDSEYAISTELQQLAERRQLQVQESLHLSVSMRSFRAESVSDFVRAALAGDATSASQALQQVLKTYPICITRNLDLAREWVRSQARGSERFGLLASSQAQRLKAHGVDIRVRIDPIHWFLAPTTDTRSSYYLEDAATEFQVQGLELDWTCVTWDADLRRRGTDWSFHSFRGDRWERIHKETRQRYLRNAYRVLLTRARQGMVICVPPGSGRDPTRQPEWYEETFQYLAGLGIPVL